MEQNFRRSLALSAGNPAIFFTRPITVGLLLIAVVILFGPIVMKSWRNARAQVAAEVEAEAG